MLALGIVSGIVTATTLPWAAPEQVGIASDVFYYAAQAALEGEDVYAVHPPDLPGYTFLYPPIVVLVFVPHALLGDPTLAYALQTILNIGAALGTAVVVQRALKRRDIPLESIDRALLYGFVLASGWTVSQLVMGQTTLWLAFAVALGLDGLERDRERLAGGAFAFAALVKVFPAVLGLWLLRRRSWIGVGAAIATGLGGLLLGAIVFGTDLTVYYLTEVLLGRHDGQSFEGVPEPDRNLATARRQLAFLFGGGSPLVTALAVAIVAPLVGVCYRSVETDAHRQTAIVATLVGTFLMLPLQPLYFTLLFYPLLVSLFVLPVGRPRRLLLAGTLVSFLRIQQELVRAGVEPLPPSIAEPVLATTGTIFTVVLPPTVGLWLLLAGCVAWHVQGSDDGEPERSTKH